MEFKSKTRITFKQKKENKLIYDEKKVLKSIRKQDPILKEIIRMYYRPFNHHMESLFLECIQGDFHKSLSIMLEEHSKGNLFETCFDPYVFVLKKIRYIFRNDKCKTFQTLVSQEYYEPNKEDFEIVCRHNASKIYLYLFQVYYRESFTVDEICEHLSDICVNVPNDNTKTIVDVLLVFLLSLEEEIYINYPNIFRYKIKQVLCQSIVNDSFDVVKKIVDFYIKLTNKKHKRQGKKGKVRKINISSLISTCIKHNRFEMFVYFVNIISANTQQLEYKVILNSLARLSNLTYVKHMLNTTTWVKRNMVFLLKEAMINANIILTKFILDGEFGIEKLFRYDTKHLSFYRKVCEEPELKYNPANTIFSHFCISEIESRNSLEYSTFFNQIINLLLDYDIDLSDYFFLILPYLSKRKDINTIKRLLQGSDVKISRDVMYKCFYFAVASDHYELFEYFVCLGYDSTCKIYEYYLDDENKKYKCLFFFKEYKDIDYLQRFSKVNEECLHNYYSENLLTIAVEYGCVDIIELIMEQGDVNPSDNDYMVMTKYSEAPFNDFVLDLLLDNDSIYNGICDWVESGIRYVLYGLTHIHMVSDDTYKELQFQTLKRYIELFISIEKVESIENNNDCICCSDTCSHYDQSSNYYIQCTKCSNSMHLICSLKWLFERLDRLEHLFYVGSLEYIPIGIFDRSLNYSCCFCRASINLISEINSYEIYELTRT